MSKFFIMAAILIGSCKAQPAALTVFDKFHFHFAKKQYDSLAGLLANDFILINEYGAIVSDKKSYLDYLSVWDNAFDTKWRVTAVSTAEGKVFSKEYDTNLMNDYLYPRPMEYQFVYTIKNNQIRQLEYDSIAGSNYFEKKQLSNGLHYKFTAWLKQRRVFDQTFFKQETVTAAIRTRKLLQEFLKRPSKR